jgi:hypothetical protein
MPKAPGSTRSGLYTPACEVVREALRLLEIGYESGYKMHSSRHTLSVAHPKAASFGARNIRPAPPITLSRKLAKNGKNGSNYVTMQSLDNWRSN